MRAPSPPKRDLARPSDPRPDLRGTSLFAFYYLLPLYVMLVNSFKPLDEIRQGGMLNLPQIWTIEPWLSAWSTAQIGVEPTGLRPFFLNSILMVVPAVTISTIIGALNGYVLTKWRFPGANVFFGMLLLSCFIPFQIVLIPMARILGILGLAGSLWGLILVHIVYGIGFTTLYFRNYYEAFPTELVRAAQIDGASFFQIFRQSCCLPRVRSSSSQSFGSSQISGMTSSSVPRSQVPIQPQ